MRIRKIATSMIALGMAASPLAYATNGDEMMAVGSQSTALGGSGVAHFMGADSVWANPAMLGKSKGAEFTGGLVSFTPKVNNTGMPGGAATDSKASTSYIPDMSYSSRMNDSMTYGVSLAGIAGMGVDYTGANATTHIKAKSALSILRVVMTMAYNKDNYGIGFSPIFQSGSLMLSYNNGAAYNAAEKKDSSTSFGFTVGGYFDVAPAFTVAGAYQSKFAAKYGTQISGAGNGFGLCQPAGGGCTGAAPFGDDLDQPAQMKLGVAYTMAESFTMTADYKLIKWGSAAGYKDFAWKDQTVIAVGAKYAANGYWLGLGYNHANDPIGTLPAASGAAGEYRNAAINFFNNMFFPAIVTNSYTFGGGYDFSKALAVEGAAVITPKVTKTVDVMNFGGSNTTTHSQQSYSVSLRYKF
ncbi:MAG TPA: outer membrane protein transport protein [Sideroxyarcus sp.]|nr:outer membrane protein transport protein [Sideroxyarcus sp.]